MCEANHQNGRAPAARPLAEHVGFKRAQRKASRQTLTSYNDKRDPEPAPLPFVGGRRCRLSENECRLFSAQIVLDLPELVRNPQTQHLSASDSRYLPEEHSLAAMRC